VQRNATLTVELGTAHLRAAEATENLDPHALGAGALGSPADPCASRGGTPREQKLLGDALRDELSLGLGVLDLEDVELDLLAGELLEVGADALGLGATAADDDAPGRAVWMSTRTRSRVRSISMRATPAPVQARLEQVRILMSSVT
jgi:hypothetical protein